MGEWVRFRPGGCLSISSLLFLLLTAGHLHAERTYGIRGEKNYVRAAADTRIPREMAKQVKVRDGYSAGEKKIVVTFVIPPELGGTADFGNLRALPKREAEQRRKVEKEVLKKVRNGQMSVGEARARVVYFQAAVR